MSRAHTNAVPGTDYLARAMPLPCGGGCFAILFDNAYYVLFSLVTMRLLRGESFLYFFPMCATCEYNILLFW